MVKLRSKQEQINYGKILVVQARELVEKLGQAVPPLSRAGASEFELVANQVSEAHELLADTRMKVPAEISEVDWEQTRIDDGRTGEDIFGRLGDLIHEMSRTS
jgi:folate-binding Fe-S cluster repair protein YgfZ